jgi:hypothetical protein
MRKLNAGITPRIERRSERPILLERLAGTGLGEVVLHFEIRSSRAGRHVNLAVDVLDVIADRISLWYSKTTNTGGASDKRVPGAELKPALTRL